MNYSFIRPFSGAGNDLVQGAIEQDYKVRISISHTTACAQIPARTGREYYFTTNESFLDMIAGDAFFEHGSGLR